MNVSKLEELLVEAEYDPTITQYLVKGFKEGFSLCYKGDKCVQRRAPNLKLRVGSPIELWNKVMTEVKAGRYAGPFEEPPFQHFIQSPIGLVPKDKGKKTRLIFHLSYPKNGNSVNSGIPKHLCTVKYPDFNDAIQLCIQVGQSGEGKAAKSDMSMAFRNIPMNKESWAYLVLMACHPVTGKRYYFVDKCLPFGSSISCAIFQCFSDAVAHLVKFRTRKPLVNYLDDYFFAAINKLLCDWQVQQFLDVCSEIRFPVSLEKTEWGSDCLVFLGLLSDLINQMMGIPKDKISKALDLIEFFLNPVNKKVTVLQVQRLCGVLNFLCRSVVPGRAFLTRIYALTVGDKLHQHHHICIKEETKLDLVVWKKFLLHPMVFSRPFMDTCKYLKATDIEMYSDASGNFELGVSAICNKDWAFGKWNKVFMEWAKPSIEYLELFGVAVAIELWIHRFQNQRICLYCDNMSVVHMINNNSAKCKNCMVLIRMITLTENVRIFSQHISTRKNGKADALSRLDFKHFWSLDPSMNARNTEIPEKMWPISKIWIL